ncbi:hypothetical protein ACIRSU_18390 [Streptomyces sp. NPDC101160]|uniref:hypothetical protein n=1 Tax=Streptomyces sp. NPDC101160 TaxID=3366118 RepID=UPI003820003B
MSRRPASRRICRGLCVAALLALLPGLAACGIQGSDVVEAGGAAPVTVQPTSEPRLLLFFVGKDGRLMPVARELHFAFGQDWGEGSGTDVTVMPSHPVEVVGYRVPTDKVLSTLLDGPEEKERAAGLTTRLTLHGGGDPHVEPPAKDGSGGLRLRLSVRVRDMDPVAVQQLVCTTAFAERWGSGVPVVISGADGSLPATTCRVG